MGRVVAPLFAEKFNDWLYGSKKKKNLSDKEFDRMIEQRKSLLRGDLQSADPDQRRSQTSSKDQFSQSLVDEFQKLSALKSKNQAQSKRFEELKELLKLTESLQWGDGENLKEMAKELTHKIHVRVEPASLGRVLKELIRRDLLIGADKRVLPFLLFKQRIETFLTLEQLYFNTEFQQSKMKAWNVSNSQFKKALFLYYKKIKSELGSVNLKSVLERESVSLPFQADNFIVKALLTRNGLNSSIILKELKDEVEFLKTLSPLPPLKGKNDKAGAYKVLGLKEGASKEHVKKQYRMLAKLKHPDRLKGKGIPAEFETIATENFARIQQAYDILK